MLYVILNLLYRERSVIGAQGTFLWPVHITNIELGVMYAGAEHRRIRTALNAGFTATAVREYEPVFQKVAESVCTLDNPVFFIPTYYVSRSRKSWRVVREQKSTRSSFPQLSTQPAKVWRRTFPD
jgi:hypothetical protein